MSGVVEVFPRRKALHNYCTTAIRHPGLNFVGPSRTGPRPRARRNPIELNLETIAQYFHLPLRIAAAHFDVSVSAFKQACRKLGISRWREPESGAFAAVPDSAVPATALPAPGPTGVAVVGKGDTAPDSKVVMPQTPRLGCSGAASEMQNHADKRYVEIGFRLGHAGPDALPPLHFAGSSLTAMPADTELTGIEFGGGHAGPLKLHCPGVIFDTVPTTRLFPDQAACFPGSSLNAVPFQASAIDFGRYALLPAHVAANSFDATQTTGLLQNQATFNLGNILNSMSFRSSDQEARNMATDFGCGYAGHHSLLPASSSLHDVPTASSGFVGMIKEQAAGSCHDHDMINFGREIGQTGHHALLPAHLPVSSFNAMPAFGSSRSFQVDQVSVQEARDMAVTTDFGRGFRLGHAGPDALPPLHFAGSSLTAMPADTELTGIEFGGGHAGPLKLHCPGVIFDTVPTTRLFPDQAACFPGSSLNAVPFQASAIDFGRYALLPAHVAANSFDATQTTGLLQNQATFNLGNILNSMSFRSSDQEARNMATDFGCGYAGHHSLLPASSSLHDVPTASSGFVGMIKEQAAGSCHDHDMINFGREIGQTGHHALLPAHLPVSSFNAMPAFGSSRSFQVDQVSVQEARDMAVTTDFGRGFRLGHAGPDALPPLHFAGSSLTAMPADTELTGIEFGGGHAVPCALLSSIKLFSLSLSPLSLLSL
jgi:hypothetical protein